MSTPAHTRVDSGWALRFLGVGSSAAVELGSASAVLEHDGRPLLMIDCGGEALTAYLKHYGEPPLALFITHAHLDHIGGMERLFFALYFDEARRGRCRLYVPATVVPLLQARLADYPGVLAEGGANWWDAFQLIPVSRGFWHAGRQFEVFPCRHHAPDTAFGLALRGSFVYSGDTRPIPEQLARYPEETLAHDCGLRGNPSHTGLDDIEREYPQAWRERLALYHYGSAADGEAMRARGYRVLAPGERLAVAAPAPSTLPAGG
ncbi:MBL fold metallo-hydrolase [uncultured Aquimonas sp.]|uniref:MBL fold metallo-hydrolase n=1 Tax=uncultured Aquimonas sp. TaxID=385483 RepID=UPI000868BE34|nr:MBL fold metallo-hydrolase [uncultured Aquimonas sp.]ODU48128.1 MAG: MBL fold metallo-hydrolase [Xanthomonadaceae bacterium SCN 69-123]